MLGSLRHAFRADIDRQVRARLERSGVSLAPGLDTVELVVRYFDYKRRVPHERPRRVHVSRELNMVALPPEFRRGLDCIHSDLLTGASIRRYFSRQWLDLESHDVLFNDWLIRHMHLGGPELEADGFVRRTGPVLFLYLRRQDAYLMDVFDHGHRNVTAFAEPRLVDVLRANWPELIEHARVPGASDLSANDAESRWVLSRRRRGPRISMGVETIGSIYTSIGGGFMSNGRSSTATQCAYTLLNRASELGELCEARRHDIIEALQRHLGERVDDIKLAFALAFLHWGVHYQVVDKLSGVGIEGIGGIQIPEWERS